MQHLRTHLCLQLKTIKLNERPAQVQNYHVCAFGGQMQTQKCVFIEIPYSGKRNETNTHFARLWDGKHLNSHILPIIITTLTQIFLLVLGCCVTLLFNCMSYTTLCHMIALSVMFSADHMTCYHHLVYVTCFSADQLFS